jgi:3-hydroxyisobutyrate dehydrogenase
MVFARKVGLDPAVMHQAVSTGAAGSWALQNLGQRMLSRDFAPMFMIDLQQKDLGIALAQGQHHKVPLPGTALVRELLGAAQAAGEGREGTQALVKTLERLSRLA